jgi:lysophospholipase L1-like esterase
VSLESAKVTRFPGRPTVRRQSNLYARRSLRLLLAVRASRDLSGADREVAMQRQMKKSTGPRERITGAGWFLALLAAMSVAGCGDEDSPERFTYAAWAASPQDYGELSTMPGAMPPPPQMLENQTIRQVVHLSAGGEALRVRLSNLVGLEPLTVDGAGVALCVGGSAIDMSSQVDLTFDGLGRVTIAPGEEVWSDFVPLATPAEADLTVSLYIAGGANVATVHRLGQQTAFVATGNAVTAQSMAPEEPAPPAPRQSYYWLTGVDVASPQPTQVVVAFGDSITDGLGSTIDANQRYPNYLSRRLTARSPGGERFSSVNAGISGNRVLRDGRGPSGLSRFGRDALGQSGVSDVIILLGINDIGVSGRLPEQDASAEAITDGLATLIAEAEARDVRVFLGTLLPFKGTNPPYYSESAEAKRQAVNAWIRGNTDVAAVIDFDAAMKDGLDPLTMSPALDSGDHLHPNDAGYEAMANAIDITLFE